VFLHLGTRKKSSLTKCFFASSTPYEFTMLVYSIYDCSIAHFASGISWHVLRQRHVQYVPSQL